MEQNQSYQGVVTGYTHDGAGILKRDGMVIFVPGAVRGETVRFRVTRIHQGVANAELCQIVTPSPYRRTPDCPYYGHCGGCAFRHVTYAEELNAKRQRVQDALTRIGGADVEVEPVIGAEQPCHYRGKCQYPVNADGVIGFYRAGSHDVVDVRDCLLQPDAANRTAAVVRDWMSRYHVSGYDERTGRGFIRHVYVRTNRRGESLCCLVVNAKSLPKEPELVGMLLSSVPETVGVVINTNSRRDNVILGRRYRTLWGQDFLYDTLRIPAPGGRTRELSFKLSLPSFYQVNPAQTETLYALALQNAALTGSETVLDLYCGIGTITLSLSLWARRTLGAEIVPEAISDACANAVRNRVTNAEFFCADASDAAQRLRADGLHPDVVTVDPPRKGLAPDVITQIASMRPARVVYVSCDPATLGRDIRRFTPHGYTVRRASAVDMFPGTPHVESVVLMSRAGA